MHRGWFLPSLLREAMEPVRSFARARATRSLRMTAPRGFGEHGLARDRPRQLNRVVRQSSQPVAESSASIAAVRPATHPQLSESWGTRATIPNPTNVAVAPPTRIQSSHVRRLGDTLALSPASAARVYAGSMP